MASFCGYIAMKQGKLNAIAFCSHTVSKKCRILRNKNHLNGFIYLYLLHNFPWIPIHSKSKPLNGKTNYEITFIYKHAVGFFWLNYIIMCYVFFIFFFWLLWMLYVRDLNGGLSVRKRKFFRMFFSSMFYFLLNKIYKFGFLLFILCIAKTSILYRVVMFLYDNYLCFM